MSAALAWDVEPLTGPLAPTGPRLRLVPTGDQVIAPAPAAVRMTRTGRFVRTVVLASVALAVTWTVVSALAAGPATRHVTTVTPGQTLSQIAASELPALPVREGVAQIQLANGLSSSEIHAGQMLEIPSIG